MPPEIELVSNPYRLSDGIPNDNQVTTKRQPDGIPNDNQVTYQMTPQVSIDKVSIDKISKTLCPEPENSAPDGTNKSAIPRVYIS